MDYLEKGTCLDIQILQESKKTNFANRACTLFEANWKKPLVPLLYELMDMFRFYFVSAPIIVCTTTHYVHYEISNLHYEK